MAARNIKTAPAVRARENRMLMSPQWKIASLVGSYDKSKTEQVGGLESNFARVGTKLLFKS